MNGFLAIKVIHIIALISWYAGLFYLPRLLVYDAEAPTRYPENAKAIQIQLRLMQGKLYRAIMCPAMIVTWGAGLILMWQSGALLQPWFHLKILLVALVTLYHFSCGALVKRHAKELLPFNGKQLRFFNEIPTVLLIGIVMSVILKDYLLIITITTFIALSLFFFCINRNK